MYGTDKIVRCCALRRQICRSKINFLPLYRRNIACPLLELIKLTIPNRRMTFAMINIRICFDKGINDSHMHVFCFVELAKSYYSFLDSFTLKNGPCMIVLIVRIHVSMNAIKRRWSFYSLNIINSALRRISLCISGYYVYSVDFCILKLSAVYLRTKKRTDSKRNW